MRGLALARLCATRSCRSPAPCGAVPTVAMVPSGGGDRRVAWPGCRGEPMHAVLVGSTGLPMGRAGRVRSRAGRAVTLRAAPRTSSSRIVRAVERRRRASFDGRRCPATSSAGRRRVRVSWASDALRWRDSAWLACGRCRPGRRGEATRVLDLTEPDQVRRVLAETHPDAIAICASWPWVDGCEADPERSQLENVGVVQNVTTPRGFLVTLVFYSTDHVFDGSADSNVESATWPRCPSMLATSGRPRSCCSSEAGRSSSERRTCSASRTQELMDQVIRAAHSGTPITVPVGQAGLPDVE